ncbi:Demethylrebeccamycin-D-glucose O-methyltransferase [BD1-7 clade bacterium]|uniref:Demethylrebeccamycin-D-glucose O-methyltransferase n=1 Tax=BD1-7 clade bacterium TaxID=2029982 RepID=A0A5S9PFA5_9GAMM|nr:Demethylrebeccamycin-D-glucose O-methyltransferase [BD1-7 clade bacterium]
MNILKHFASTYEEGLHAKGALSTQFLLTELEVQAGNNVLDFGCGSATSLVRLAATYPDCEIYGVDACETMLRSARSRLKFCGLSDVIHLTQIEAAQKLPFNDAFFDCIYIESVLAIQSDDSLPSLLTELSRVLKTWWQVPMQRNTMAQLCQYK